MIWFLFPVVFLAGYLAGRRTRLPASVPPPPEVRTPPPNGVPAEILSLMESRVKTPCQDMDQVRSIVADAAAHLASSFTELNSLIRSQQEGLREIFVEMRGEGGETDSVTVGGLSGEMADTAELLSQFVILVVGLSKQSMDLYYCVESIAEGLASVSKLVVEVRSIASQTGMIALNAAIESARAGEAGRSFQVVASEVRQLAEHSRRVSEDITSQVKDAGTAVETARRIAEKSASQDLSMLLTSKMRTDRLASGIAELDRKLRERLDSVADISAQVGDKTAIAVRSLQFEDIARQILESSKRELEGLHAMVVEVRDAAGSDSAMDSDLTALARAIMERHQAEAQHKPAQDTVAAGDIELF